MKPAPFEYRAPTEIEEAVGLLAEYGDEGKVLAGGQSLVPLLNFRLARPETLIDINRLQQLSYVRRERNRLRIGAMTRHAVLERSPLVAQHWPLLTQAMPWVGHPQIRSRGTVGGSVAHADPAAELPVALTALDARFHAVSQRGQRVLEADEMFRGQLESGLAADELLIEIEVPAHTRAAGVAFVEFARRHGDFALGGAAAVVELEADGTCGRVAAALLGAGPSPLRPRQLEQDLVGRTIDAVTASEVSDAAVATLAPTGDIHGSTEYRRRLLGTMLRRALTSAAQRAGENRS